jgi:hypothetical protein
MALADNVKLDSFSMHSAVAAWHARQIAFRAQALTRPNVRHVKLDFIVTAHLAALPVAISVCIAPTHPPSLATSALLNFSLQQSLLNLAVTVLVSCPHKLPSVGDFLPAWKAPATAMMDMALLLMMDLIAKRPAELTPNAGSTRNAPADFVVVNRRFILTMALTVFQVGWHFRFHQFPVSSMLSSFRAIE